MKLSDALCPLSVVGNPLMFKILTISSPSHQIQMWLLLMSPPCIPTFPTPMASLPWNISLINASPHSIPSTQFFVHLTHNNFCFKSHHHLQVKGMAVGTHMAPSYANLFMGHLEQDFLGSQLDKPSLWLRFIDDIFLLWCHGPNSFTAFLEWLNS